MDREDFLTQLRRVNSERYDVWASRPLMLCEHCGRDESATPTNGCTPPFNGREHSFTKPHPYLTVSNDAGIMFDALELGGEVGELLNVVKKMEREDRGWRGSRAAPDDFADECADVLICLDKLARRKGVDLADATARKFNATSDKVGLSQKLSPTQPPLDLRVAVEALDDLQQAEAEYRLMHDRHGDGSQASGRAWDLMRRAGDKARKALSTLTAQADSGRDAGDGEVG